MRSLPKIDPDEARRIVAATAVAAQIEMACIYGHSRTPPVVQARQVAQFLMLKRIKGTSLGAVARYFGMDHTSIRSNALRVREDIARQGPRLPLMIKAAQLLESGFQVSDLPPRETAAKAIVVVPPQPSSGYIASDGAIICAP